MIVHLGARNDLEALEQGFRFGPPMGLDNTDHDIGALGQLSFGRKQHLIGFADAGCGAKKHLKAAPALVFALRLKQQRVRRWTILWFRFPPCP